eukprot:356721-Chlamydomonas_euryale.AAC.8
MAMVDESDDTPFSSSASNLVQDGLGGRRWHWMDRQNKTKCATITGLPAAERAAPLACSKMNFSKGKERFLATKGDTPGPGAYDPKLLEHDIGFKEFGRATGERFADSTSVEGSTERPLSPARQRKLPSAMGSKKEYASSTVRIHELMGELEAAVTKNRHGCAPNLLHMAMEQEQDKVIRDLKLQLQKAMNNADQKAALQLPPADQPQDALKTAESQYRDAACKLEAASKSLEATTAKHASLSKDHDELMERHSQLQEVCLWPPKYRRDTRKWGSEELGMAKVGRLVLT